MSAVKLIPACGGGSVSLAPPNSTSGADVTFTLPSTSRGFGKVLQYVTATSLGVSSTTSSTSSEISSDLRLTMTPLFSTSKLIITANLTLHTTSGVIAVRMYRQDTGGSLQMVNEPSSFNSSVWHHGNTMAYANSDPIIQTTLQVIETAGSTTERFYSPYYAINSGTATNNSYAAGTSYTSTSTMTVIEVAA